MNQDNLIVSLPKCLSKSVSLSSNKPVGSYSIESQLMGFQEAHLCGIIGNCKMGFLDAGVGDHVDIQKMGPNQIAEYRDWEESPLNFHGMHTLGQVAAKPGSSIGTGAAYGCEFYSYRCFGPKPSDGRIEAIREGYQWLIDQGCKIINSSIYINRYDAEIDRITREAYEDKGVLFITAAGNYEGKEPSYPANLPHHMSVMSLDIAGNLSSFSHEGGDISAYGENIYSTWPDDEHGPSSGTSMACPFVAAASATTLHQWYNFTGQWLHARDVYKLVKAFAIDIGPKGNDRYTGAGRVKAKIFTEQEARDKLGAKEEVISRVQPEAWIVDYFRKFFS